MDATCMRQLVLVKYLFQRGEKALDLHNEMACGVAISHFQDAVEMLLYAAVKEKGLEGKRDQRGFPDLWKAVDGRVKLPSGAAMMELNTARVGFKHCGNLPAASDAEKFLVYTRQFLVAATQVIFGEDFESVSLADLIKDEEVKGLLKGAELHLARGEIPACMSECAKAHGLASRLSNRVLPRMSHSMSVTVEYGDPPTKNPFVDLGNYLNVLRDISLAAILDIPANDFFRYAALDQSMPLVISDIFGNARGLGSARPQTTEYCENDARFTLRYVTDYVLAIQEHINVLS